MGLRDAIVKAFSSLDTALTPIEDIEQKAVTINGLRWWGAGAELDIDSRDLERTTAYAASALAFICIKYRAKKLAEAPPMVVEESDEGDEWLDDHPLNPILSKPNADMTMRQLYKLTSIYRDITGRCVWLKQRNNADGVSGLYPFAGDDVVVTSTKDRLWGRFRIRTNRGQRDYGPDDVVFFNDPNPADLLQSLSPLDAALRTLDIGESLRIAARNTLKNAMSPSGAISIPEFVTGDQFDELQTQVQEQYGGVKNSGKWLLMSGGAKWETIARTLKDLMPTELVAWVESTVCAAFEVHPSMLGLKTGVENSPWSQLKSAQRLVYDEMALPRWAADEELLTEQLLRETDDDPVHLIRFDTSRIPILQEDMKEKAEILKIIAPYLDYDGALAFLGMEPVGGEIGKFRHFPADWVPAEIIASGGVPDVPRQDADNGEGEEE